MAGTDIASGVLTPHGDVVQPLDPSQSPGVQAPTAIAPNADAREQGGVMDTTGMFQAQMAAGEADCAAAQAYSMQVRNGMLAHYEAGVLPLGSPAIDQMDLPPVPEDSLGWGSATPAANSYLYGPGGDQPGRDPQFVGNEPQ